MQMRNNEIARRSIGALAATAVLAAVTWMAGAQAQDNDAAAPNGEATPAVPSEPSSYRDIPTETLFKELAAAFEFGSAEYREDSLGIRIARDDVLVIVEGNEVPISAGVEHNFYFYRCPCGTILTHGAFLLRDYEVNDVIDMLRENPEFKIVGTGAFLLGEDPRLVMLRFQGEGHADELAKTLSSAFRWIGEARSQPMKPQMNTDEHR